MIMRKMLVALCGLLCLLTVCVYALGETEPILPDAIEMYYFYDELCGACDGAEAFDEIARQALADVRDQYPYVIHRLNTYTRAGKERYDELLGEMEIDASTVTLPVLIVGGKLFQGDDTIEKNMTEAFLVAGEDLFVRKSVYNPAKKRTGDMLFADYVVNPNAVTVVYFYRITCDECNEAKLVIDALPETVSVNGRKLKLNVIRINTRSGNNGERISAFFEMYNVPDEERVVPIVFTADAYFAGIEAISGDFLGALAQARTGFAFPAGE